MKINFKKLDLKILILLGLFILVILSGVAYVVAVGTYSDGYRLNAGNVQDITINDSGARKKITNNSGKDLFIPTKTTAEWNAFVANKPSGVIVEESCTPTAVWTNLGTCSVACGGGVTLQRCDATCGATCSSGYTNGQTAYNGPACNTQSCSATWHLINTVNSGGGSCAGNCCTTNPGMCMDASVCNYYINGGTCTLGAANVTIYNLCLKPQLGWIPIASRTYQCY